MNYPRGLVEGMEPFNPIEVSKETEKIVIDGNRRKYNKFGIESFYGQIATARGVGCNLRCGFCWINPSRDYPEKYGIFCSPEEVYKELIKVSSNQYGRAIMSSGVRISGCEPTISKEHLFSVIDICKKGKDFRWFLLETNGILLGNDEDYVRELKKFGDYLAVRLSFKAGTPEAFQKKTGAKAKFFELQFHALEYLKKYEIPCRLAAMSKDPEIMPPEERFCLLKRLAEYKEETLFIDEETADPFRITKKRLEESGIADPNKIKREVYESVHIDKNTEFSPELFKTEKPPCAYCSIRNPWHGHDIKHDLDEKLE